MSYNSKGERTNASILVRLGRLFYAIDPSDHTYEHAKDVPNYFAETIPLLFGFMILEIIIGILKGDTGFKMFYVFNNVAGSMVQMLFHQVVITPFMFYVYCYVYEHYRLVSLPWDSMWTWYLAFLLVDFTYYWFHRSTHEVNFLWAAHQMHHSSEDFNLTTAARQSLVQKYFKGFFYLPMAVVIPPSIHLIHNQFNLLYQFWIHTEIVGKLGPLEYILNTASHHRVHHGRNPYCVDKNYGGTLIIWDRLFNTFAEEDEKVAYGLLHENNSANPLWLQLGHYIGLFKRLWNLPTWSDKINCIFRAPGWMAEIEKVGMAPEDFVLHEVEQPIRLRDMERFQMENRLETRYVLFHFLITTIVFQEFFARRASSYSVTVVYGCLAYVFGTLTSCGFVLENRWFWYHLEAIRCFAVIVADVYLTLNSIKNPLLPGVVVYAVRAVNIISLLVTSFYILIPKEEVKQRKKKITKVH